MYKRRISFSLLTWRISIPSRVENWRAGSSLNSDWKYRTRRRQKTPSGRGARGGKRPQRRLSDWLTAHNSYQITSDEKQPETGANVPAATH